MDTVSCSTNSKSKNSPVKDGGLMEKDIDQGDDQATPNFDQENAGKKETMAGTDELDFEKPKAKNPPLDVFDGHDNEFPNQNIHLLSLNQEDGSKQGHYVRIKSVLMDGKETLAVSSDGTLNDENACWIAHFTLDDYQRQVVIFENLGWKHKKNEKCVLCVKKNNDGDHFTLSIKKMETIPEQLAAAEDSICFLKYPKSKGSEIVYFESAISTKDKRLLMGFNSQGMPLPMEEVKEHSKFFEPYFRVMPCRHEFK